MMHVHEDKEARERSDSQIIKALKNDSDTGVVFTATRKWRLEKMRQSIWSRGDYFDRKGVVVFELNSQEVLRVSVCNLPVTIGRGEKADCRLDHEGISRVHCRLESIGNLVRLCDDGSKNGTRLNGKVIDFEDLCDGDEIQIGSISVRVKRV